MATIISSKTTSGGGLSVTGDSSGILQLASADGTTAVTIDASQNVGIGTASPIAGTKLIVKDGYTAFQFNSWAVYPTYNSYFGAIGTNFSAGGSELDFWNTVGSGFTFKKQTGASAHTELMRIDSDGLLKFNSGYGSVATAYGCRAWVNFNGTGTVAIRASGNVSSITDNGTGDYTVNFTTALVDANYSAVMSVGSFANNTTNADILATTHNASASACRLASYSRVGAFTDVDQLCVSVFR